MSKPTWEDVSSYSRGDRREPKTWQMVLTEHYVSRVTVHRHIHYPDRWLVSCPCAGLDCWILDAAEADAAKREALALVLCRLAELLAAANAALQG